ncbi:MAG TPA: ABC transporter ATP-binding protein [Methylomirabilota bacterium]|nr:ABC transporter ATP-binding protein [Methylomirabilota bacterium]
MEWAVELRGVSKRFLVRRNPAHSLKIRAIGLFHARYRERREELWAVRDVDLAIRPGECLGLIGPNGSGKSTLLRLMAGIFPPTGGTVTTRGRVAAIIELGLGFHPDLTGRENIYLSTSLYSLSSRDTDAIYEDIVRFAELEEFIDLPIKNYSAGMSARLGFSIAAHLEPDVMLVDEVLAVGDERFQQKCIERMQESRRRGTTIVLVSHATGLVERLADRACLLLRGRLEADGEPAKVVARYREALGIGPPPG